MRLFKEMLQKNSKKILYVLIGMFLLFIILMVYQAKQPMKAAVKVVEKEKKLYEPVNIWKKYPKDFEKFDIFLEEIKKNIVRKEVIKKKDYEKKHMIKINYYDKKDILIYTIEDKYEINQSSYSSGRGGSSGKMRPFPKEEGFVYDDKGRIIKKMNTEPSYYTGFPVIKVEDEARKSYLFNGFTSGAVYYTEYTYNENGEVKKEYKLKPTQYYEKEIIDYENGKKKKSKKIIDDEVITERWNKIYVEIDKEYDEEGKLIKKYVLRKNKFNAMRSETDFDIKKGEIVTKYYDGDKVFATVTETMVGKDKAIVKRERVGDEWKSLGIVKLVNNNGKSELRYSFYIENKKEKIIYAKFEECKLSTGTSGAYNYGYNGIENIDYIKDIFNRFNVKKDNIMIPYDFKKMMIVDLKDKKNIINNYQFIKEKNVEININFIIGKILKKQKIKFNKKHFLLIFTESIKKEMLKTEYKKIKEEFLNEN